MSSSERAYRVFVGYENEPDIRAMKDRNEQAVGRMLADALSIAEEYGEGAVYEMSKALAAASEGTEPGTEAHKRALVTSLVLSVLLDILGRSKHWPQDWDGHELRQLVADRFAGQTTGLMGNKRKARRRDYENAVATLNL